MPKSKHFSEEITETVLSWPGAIAGDVTDVLALLGLNYDRAVSRPGAAAGSKHHSTTRTRRGDIS